MKFKILKNIFWLLAERFVQVIATFIISGLISRQLGVAEYGDFQYILSVILIFSAAGLICSAEVLLPKVTLASKEELNDLILSSFILRLIAAFVAYFLMILYGNFYFENEKLFYLLCILGITILFREPFAVVLIYFQSITFSKPIALTSIALSTFKILILLIGFNEKIIDFKFLCVIWILEVLISSVIYSYLYFNEINKLEVVQKVKLKNILKLWKEGFMYWMPLVLMTFFWRIDRILVKNIVSEHDAGIYLAGMQLFDAVVSIALIISVSLAPSLIYQYSDEIKIKVNSFKLVFFMTMAGIICAFIGYFFSPYLVPRVFGAAFIEAVPIVQTALCLSLLVFVDAALTVNLIKRLGAYYAFKKWISIIFIAVPIEYFAVTLWGGQAAHLGIAAGYCFALIFGFYQLNKS